MKKTLLATAIAGALGASAAAQAATVYDQDGTRLDVYGRIAMGIEGGGPEYDSNDNYQDNGAEFVDVYSRLGLRMSQEVTSDLTAFGRLEWRFDGDENTTDGGFESISASANLTFFWVSTNFARATWVCKASSTVLSKLVTLTASTASSYLCRSTFTSSLIVT